MPADLTMLDFGYARGNKPSTVNITGDWRFLTPEKRTMPSPCRLDCLLDGEIPQWLEAVKNEAWDEAWDIMQRNNPFPALTGYVCFHPCTNNCNRGELDQAITINDVEKAVGLWRHKNYVKNKKAKHFLKKRIAIAGSGPAGMSCAYYLAEAGYEVTVFERSELLGGMFALGIPEYRLPRAVLDNEIAILKEEGVRFITGSEVGKSIHLKDLYKEFDEVFFATGAWISRRSKIPGEECRELWNALDFLSAVNSGNPPKLKDPVIVIGGGNAAIDSARSALRMDGVNHVTLIYRRSRVEMPAETAEVEAAEYEGVELVFNALPREIELEGDCIKTIIFDHSKTNREGLTIDRSCSFTKDCGAVIMALGQEPDYSIFSNIDQEVSLFAGGDLISGAATVPEAIRAGRIAAASIRSKLEGIEAPSLADEKELAVRFEDLNLDAHINLQLQQQYEDPVDEASRCLGCGTCNSCGICYLFCPDMAVEIENGRYKINLDYCKGCGICVKECPAQSMYMEGGR